MTFDVFCEKNLYLIQNELLGQSHVHLCWLEDQMNNFHSWHQPLTWVSARSYRVTQVRCRIFTCVSLITCLLG